VDYTATAPFANFGGTVDFLAPGVNIISTLPANLCGQHGWTCLDEGPYAVSSGSSFATPMVAGAVALVLAQYPDLPPEFAVNLLLNGRRSGATVADSPVLDVAAAMDVQIFGAAAPGVSRDGGGAPPGPAAPD
jgi:subtilisin family serine protease